MDKAKMAALVAGALEQFQCEGDEWVSWPAARGTISVRAAAVVAGVRAAQRGDDALAARDNTWNYLCKPSRGEVRACLEAHAFTLWGKVPDYSPVVGG